jgi:hypothetical protein
MGWSESIVAIGETWSQKDKPLFCAVTPKDQDIIKVDYHEVKIL